MSTQSTTMRAAALVSVAALTSSALADSVTIDFEGLTSVFDASSSGPYDQVDNEFIASGIDFNASGIAYAHTSVLAIAGGDGLISLSNLVNNGSGGVTGTQTLVMTAAGSTWDSFSILALTFRGGSMTAFDAFGDAIETIDLGTTLGSGTNWQTFEFNVTDIARVEVSSDNPAGGDLLIDSIHFDPTDSVVIPLPGSGMLALAGITLVGVGTRRRS